MLVYNCLINKKISNEDYKLILNLHNRNNNIKSFSPHSLNKTLYKNNNGENSNDLISFP